MKKTLGLIILVSLYVSGFAQHMRVKKPEFTFFNPTKKRVTPVLEKLSSSDAKSHPEYGILPFNAQCSECVELIDKRTLTSRFFTDPLVPTHTFSQESYFPLHFKKGNGDIWRTIDPRLRLDVLNPGVYSAENQPVPTKCDINRQITSLTTGGIEFVFNKDLTLYFAYDSLAFSKEQKGNYRNYTIGEQGLAVTNIWPGIDMQQIFSTGEVKTNYIIKNPMEIPVTGGYMVIEDHFNLPEGYRFEESEGGTYLKHHEFQGDYELKNAAGNTIVRYRKPVYIDANAVGIQGMYQLKRSGNDYTLMTLIPVKWLNRVENVYPLTIDPTVSGDSAMGNFISSTLPSANLGFTTVALGFCPYHMTVHVPGMSLLMNTYADLEYRLTYSNACGNPPEPLPYCLFSQVKQYLSCDQCPQDQQVFSCRNLGDTTGYCTTDSSIRVSGGIQPRPATYTYPQFLFCYPPQCPDYHIPFTLKNTDSICGDQCGYLCARGSKWAMTIEACTVSGFITQNKTQVCAGQSATFTAHPTCGVPPYHFIWTPDGGNTYDTVYGNTDFVVTTSNTISTPTTIYISCYIGDTCYGDPYPTNTLQLDIIPSPRADAGPDKNLCLGGTTAIGGSPTTDNGATTIWTGSTPAAQSWLSSTTTANPQVAVPAGTIDTFFYALVTNDVTCPNTDTVYVYSSAGEKVGIDTSGATRICAGASVRLNTVGGPFLSYLWNNGITDPAIVASNGGAYFVIVKDSLGCRDTSNIITVSTFGPPSVTIFPDTTILSGDSVQLYSDVNLLSTVIDSFFWYPQVNISCTNCTNPLVAPLSDETYGLTIYSHGCEVSAKVLIQVIQPNNFYIPNVFTPNGDGNNDKFYIEYQNGVTVLLFQVFDRWGEKVHDGMYPWDGTYKGKPAPPGVYVYTFKLQLYGSQLAVFRKGSVTLLK